MAMDRVSGLEALSKVLESALRNSRKPYLVQVSGNLEHMPYTRKVGMNAPKPVYR